MLKEHINQYLQTDTLFSVLYPCRICIISMSYGVLLAISSYNFSKIAHVEPIWDVMQALAYLSF